MIKHYIEDLIFKNFERKLKKNLNIFKNDQKLSNRKSIIKISYAFEFFGSKSKKKVFFFSVLSHGITHQQPQTHLE